MRTALRIDHAHSMNNGILFYSSRHRGYVAKSTVDEFGNINAEWTTTKKCEKEVNNTNKVIASKNLIVLFLCILPITLFFTLGKTYPVLCLQLVLIYLPFVMLTGFITANIISIKKDNRSYKFHSAEHMVLNAYRKLGRAPSLEEVQHCSRFSSSCSTNLTAQLVMTLFALFLCSFIFDFCYMMLAMVISSFMVLVLLFFGFFNFFQYFTTVKPTKKELMVAITGLSVWLENEKK